MTEKSTQSTGVVAEKPRPLTVAEIQEYVALYAQAAKNAVETAGFDGVEIHAANGCLSVQFLQDVSRNRTDTYGGSAENRMGMADPVPTFSHIVSELKRLRPTLAYIHVIEPRISADSSVDASPQNAGQSDDFIRDIWGDRPLISGGGFTRDSGIKLAEERKNSLVAHGRHFIANPDLPVRLQKNIPLHPYDRSTFYLPGLGAPTGYTDQPFASSATPAA